METELSLVIQNPEQGQFLKHIDWNREAFMELISGITERYKGIVFTEDQIKEAKAERARLNAMKKAISDRRVQVKKEVMAPYDQFEAEVKEVVALIDGPIEEIDTQIKNYEERQKTEKKDTLRKYFDEIRDGLDDAIDFERLFDKKYLNVSVSLASAKRDIKDKVDRIRLDLENIQVIEDEYRFIVRDAYLRTLDTGKAYGEMYRLKDMKRRDEERREAIARQEAAERGRAEREKAEREAAAREAQQTIQPVDETENPPAKTSDSENTPPEQPHHDAPPADPPAEDPFINRPKPKQYKASFTVYGTKDEIMSVRQYMIDRNIRFGKVEQK
ncbi:MAG: DUF1351 domain-containing protein [Oscillospiraceae bacterium]|nr:DUF1351 domain-containing protein [Oscillospiraceae bacterium]